MFTQCGLFSVLPLYQFVLAFGVTLHVAITSSHLMLSLMCPCVDELYTLLSHAYALGSGTL